MGRMYDISKYLYVTGNAQHFYCWGEVRDQELRDPLFQPAQATLTKPHRWGLKQRTSISHGSGG